MVPRPPRTCSRAHGGRIRRWSRVYRCSARYHDQSAGAARRFNQVAWPAFAVLVLTGIWNIIAVRAQVHGSYETTLIVKLVVVAISGITAALHARAKTTAGLAVFGALTGISALAALFLGVLLAG